MHHILFIVLYSFYYMCCKLGIVLYCYINNLVTRHPTFGGMAFISLGKYTHTDWQVYICNIFSLCTKGCRWEILIWFKNSFRSKLWLKNENKLGLASPAYLLRNWGRLPIENNEFVFHWCHLPFAKTLRSSSICQTIEVVYHLQKYWDCLPFPKLLRTFSICQNIEVVFHLPKYWGLLSLTKKLRLSSISSQN